MEEETKTVAFKPGDVLRYSPRSTHCRDGVAIIDEHGNAYDTYWGMRDSMSFVRPEDLRDAEVQFRLEDYDEITGVGRDTARMKWEKFANEDRECIPAHSGYHARFFTRKGAEPSLDTQIENARRDLAYAEDKARGAANTVEWKREDLERLIAQRAEAGS
jgi:hypothetical protein